MHYIKRIKETAEKTLYGAIDQQFTQKEKLIYGLAGLIVSILAQISLAYWLIPNRIMLNILATPFQLVGILSLMYVIQSFTKYPYREESIWNIKDKQHIPFFIRTRVFMYKSVFIATIASQYITVYMDWAVRKVDFNFWLCANILFLSLFVLTSFWIKSFIDNFEHIIKSTSYYIKRSSDKEDY